MPDDENKVYSSMLEWEETENRTAYTELVGAFTLGQLIDYLEECDPEFIVKRGFYNPHSYRGYYEELAFEPVDNISIEEMLNAAKWALGKEFQGYKGGWFGMNEHSYVNIAYQGHGFGERIGRLIMDYMTGQV